MGNDVVLIDSGAAAADSAFDWLKSQDMLNGETGGSYRYFVSDSTEDFAKLGGMFLSKPICENVEKIDIEKF